MAKQEFNFGIEVKQVVNVRIYADTQEEAVKLFEENDGQYKEYEQTVLSSNFQVLGMIEGPLPTPPQVELDIVDAEVTSESVH